MVVVVVARSWSFDEGPRGVVVLEGVESWAPGVVGGEGGWFVVGRPVFVVDRGRAGIGLRTTTTVCVRHVLGGYDDHLFVGKLVEADQQQQQEEEGREVEMKSASGASPDNACSRMAWSQSCAAISIEWH